MKRALIVLGLTLVAGGALVGCGSGSKGPGVASANGAGPSATARPTPTTSQDRQQQMVDYARCMRAHGVDVPDPDPGGGGAVKIQVPQGTSQEKMRAAQEACKQYLPNGGAPPSLSPEQLAAAQKFAQCMREHGIDIPDPDPGNPGIRIRNIDPNDPKFKAAQQACQGLLPGNLQLGTGGGK
ncbi:MAG: hypothetical protein J2P15_08055 [Micromonosporaceae bacterium]|nr:hypothetical protein [Micromonosporaceae bacterium]